MKKFAKLFEMPDGGQVLVCRSYDSETKEYCLTQRTETDNVTITLTGTFHDEERADAAFEAYDQEAAEKFYPASINSLLEK